MHTCNTDINIHFEKCYEINFWSWVNCFSSNILKILENWFCMLVVFNEVYIIPQKTNNVVSKVSYHHCKRYNTQIKTVKYCQFGDFNFDYNKHLCFRWKRWNRQCTMRRPIRHYHAILYQEVGIKSINFQC